MNEFKKVMEPLQVKNTVFRNRLVFPAVVTNYATSEGFVSKGLVDFHCAIAQNVGLDIVEATPVRDKGGVWDTQVCAFDDKYIYGLARLAEAIRSNGAVAVLQIYDAGARSGVGGRIAIPFAPSKIPAGIIGNYDSVEMTVEDIKCLVEAFSNAAMRAFKAGFKGVEIHGAHGYLINAFLTPYLNKRTDEYGGGLENRARFLLEIVQAIKETVPKGFLIICRINGDEPFENGTKIDDAKKIAILLDNAGCDIVSVSAIARKIPVKLPTGERFIYTTCVPSKKHKDGCYLDYAEQIKRVVKVPVIAVGKIRSLAMAEKILLDGKADLTALARVLIADPEMPRKELEGRKDEISLCTEELKCMLSIVAGKPMECKQNPALPPRNITERA